MAVQKAAQHWNTQMWGVGSSKATFIYVSVLFGLSPMCPYTPTPLISRSQNPPVHLHNFSFSDYFPCGVGAMLHHPQLNVLLIGSDTGSVSGWRLLDGFPRLGTHARAGCGEGEHQERVAVQTTLCVLMYVEDHIQL